jgi:intein/homing endonuclease
LFSNLINLGGFSVLEKSDITTPWGPIGYITYKRTYARRVKEDQADSPTEEFHQTVERIVKACKNQLHVGFTDAEEKRLKEIIMSLKGIVAGRFLWQLGTRTVNELGLMSLQNCAAVVVNEPIRPFTWAMDSLMLGTGVGFNIQREYVYELPKPKKAKIVRLDTKDADYIVPDTRAGWVKLLEQVLKAHFETGEGFSYSTILIRGSGAPIRGFGGIASGPESLCWGIDQISKILNNRAGKKIRPIDALDIMNIIGYIVVSGNVRRSALIALGDADDLQYLNAKRWDLGNIPNWRAMSNNSVVCNDINLLPEQFWEGYNGNGEPYGLINLKLSRSCGRLGETQYPDDGVVSYNPCAEQSLHDYETCCLAETYLPNIKSKEELKEVVTYLYRINKHSLRLPCKNAKETEAVVHKNMRMGIGVTGYLQATEEQKSWLKETYEYLREYDKEYSKTHNWPISIKLTTCKPSGCQKADTLVITENGILQLDEIGDINGEKWQNHTIQVAQENCDKLSTKFYVNGKAKTKKVLLDSGLSLESTINHQYRVLRNGDYVWIKVEDIQIGDKLPYRIGGYNSEKIQPLMQFDQKIHTNAIKIKQPEFLNEDLAWVLGLYFGDGSNHDKGIRIAGDSNKLEILEKAKKIIFEQFGIVSSIYGRDIKKGKLANNSDLYVNSQGLLQFLSENNLLKQFSDKIEIPKIIRMSSKKVISSFIDGYAHADGCFKGNNLSFCTVSKKWAEQLVVLLRAIGTDCKLREMPPTESSFGDNMRYWISTRKGRKAPTRYLHKDKQNDYKILDSLNLNELSTDIVVKISDGECETYDIEVPENNCYLANSYISHNTLSLLAGVTSGVHPAYAQYFIRRIRMASNSDLVEVCKKNGYPVEYQQNFDGSEDHNTVVVSFPCMCPIGTVLAKDTSAVRQLEFVKRLQSEWSDNSVSVTVYYRKEELPEIKQWLKENFNFSVKTVSFLLHNEHGFKQAPYEEITKEKYEELISKVTPITSVNVAESDMKDSFECAGGMCPIK